MAEMPPQVSGLIKTDPIEGHVQSGWSHISEVVLLL